MGVFFSTPDISWQVNETVRQAKPRMQELQRDIPSDGCPGLTFSNMKSLFKYKNFDFNDTQTQYRLINAVPRSESIPKICHNIRQRESQKIFLIDKIISSLELYRNLLSWLIDGDYCATAKNEQNRKLETKWTIQRYKKDGISKYRQDSCDGQYVPLLMALEGPASLNQNGNNHDIAGALAWDKVYRLTDRENAKWKNMVDNLRSSFTSCWRKLKKILEKLLVEEILTAEDLINHANGTEIILSHLEDEFQIFMHDALEKDMVRPLSVADTRSRRLEKQIEKSELAAQNKIISEAKDTAFSNMIDTARAKWKMPLSGAPAVFDNNHFSKYLSS